LRPHDGIDLHRHAGADIANAGIAAKDGIAGAIVDLGMGHPRHQHLEAQLLVAELGSGGT
jgi:hypothetical protein